MSGTYLRKISCGGFQIAVYPRGACLPDFAKLLFPQQAEGNAYLYGGFLFDPPDTFARLLNLLIGKTLP